MSFENALAIGPFRPASRQRPLANMAREPHFTNDPLGNLVDRSLRFEITVGEDAQATYARQNRIAKGAFGSVFAFKRSDGFSQQFPQTLAVKVFRDERAWSREKAVYELLKQKFEARCGYGYVRGYATELRRWFSEAATSAVVAGIVVMENARPFATIREYLVENEDVAVPCFEKIARDVVAAVDCLARTDPKSHLVYTDLKAKNCLAQTDPNDPLGFRVILADLGSLVEVDAAFPNESEPTPFTHFFNLFPGEVTSPFNVLCDGLVLFLLETLDICFSSEYDEDVTRAPPIKIWESDFAEQRDTLERARVVNRHLLRSISEIENDVPEDERAELGEVPLSFFFLANRLTRSSQKSPFALLRKLADEKLMMMYQNGKARYDQTVIEIYEHATV